MLALEIVLLDVAPGALTALRFASLAWVLSGFKRAAPL
jgi:hypothetical protein